MRALVLAAVLALACGSGEPQACEIPPWCSEECRAISGGPAPAFWCGPCDDPLGCACAACE